MSWSAPFLSALESFHGAPSWRFVVVPTNAPGDAWSVASHEDGTSDEVSIADGSVRIESNTLAPRGWAVSFGGFSFQIVGDPTDFLSNVTRGTIGVLYMGLGTVDVADMEPVALGQVRNITRAGRGVWAVECIDITVVLRARLATAQDQHRLFYDLPADTVIAGSAYTPGDTTIEVADVSIFGFDSAGSGAVRVTPSAGDPFILTFTGTATGPDRLTGVSAAGQYGTTAAAASVGNMVEALALVEGKPGAVFAKLLTSKDGTNGSRDTLPGSWGLGVDDSLVDIIGLDNLDLGALAPSSGNFTLTLLVDSVVEDALSWFVGWMSAIGMFPTIAQGQFTAGVAQDTATATPVFAIDDEEIAEVVSWTGWDEGHDPEYQFVRVLSATGNTASSGSAAATLPTDTGLIYDASALIWANESAVRDNILNRVTESAKRVPEHAVLRLHSLRAMAWTPGDVGEVTYTGSWVRRGGAGGWSSAPCVLLRVSPDVTSCSCEVEIVVYPDSEAVYG